MKENISKELLARKNVFTENFTSEFRSLAQSDLKQTKNILFPPEPHYVNTYITQIEMFKIIELSISNFQEGFLEFHQELEIKIQLSEMKGRREMNTLIKLKQL